MKKVSSHFLSNVNWKFSFPLSKNLNRFLTCVSGMCRGTMGSPIPSAARPALFWLHPARPAFLFLSAWWYSILLPPPHTHFTHIPAVRGGGAIFHVIKKHSTPSSIQTWIKPALNCAVGPRLGPIFLSNNLRQNSFIEKLCFLLCLYSFCLIFYRSRLLWIAIPFF